MQEVNIKDCLRVWRRKYGEEKTGRSHGQTYWRIPIQNRRHLIVLFLRWMRAVGMEEERFRKASFQTELIDICFGTAPAFDEKKRKGGHDALREELADILATEGIFTGRRRKNNKNSKPFVKPVHVEPAFKPIGRDLDPALYAQDDADKPELDPEWAKMMGVTEDE